MRDVLQQEVLCLYVGESAMPKLYVSDLGPIGKDSREAQ